MDRDGEVCVGQVVRSYQQRGSAPGFTRDDVKYVAHITMQHGFAGVLLNLRRLEQRDMNEMYDARLARIQKDNDLHYDAVVSTYQGDFERLLRKGEGIDGFIRALIGPDPRGPRPEQLERARLRAQAQARAAQQNRKQRRAAAARAR